MAKAFLLKNEKVLKKLVPYLAERQVLQAEESDELLKQWGGLRYE